MELTRAEWLADLINRRGLNRAAEVGVQGGQTSRHLLEHCPGLHLIGVDLWEPQMERPEEISRHGHYRHDANEQTVRFLAAHHTGRFQVIKGMSAEVGMGIESQSLDLVFIDADHAEDSVLADIKAWRRTLKPGGYLTGHDISMDGVRAAVDMLAPGYETGPDDTWMVRV